MLTKKKHIMSHIDPQLHKLISKPSYFDTFKLHRILIYLSQIASCCAGLQQKMKTKFFCSDKRGKHLPKNRVQLAIHKILSLFLLFWLSKNRC